MSNETRASLSSVLKIGLKTGWKSPAVTLVAGAVIFLHSASAHATDALPAIKGCEASHFLTSNEVLSEIYGQVQYLGIAVPNHNSMSPFAKLGDFLVQRGLDPALKTVAVEDSADLQELYESGSVNEINYPTFEALGKSKFAGINVQTQYVVENILPLVREINRHRGNDPLLIVPIDSMTTAGALQLFSFDPNITLKSHSKSVSVQNIDYRFPSSIERERRTAANFKRLISDRFPGRKGIVIYHGAHIFKNLSAIGTDTMNGKLVAKKAFLPWLSIAQKLVPALGDYKVVAVDYPVGATRQGSYLLPAAIEKAISATESESKSPLKTTGCLWEATVTSTADIFSPKAFLTTYRAGTVQIIDPSKPVFDAIIVDR